MRPQTSPTGAVGRPSGSRRAALSLLVLGAAAALFALGSAACRSTAPPPPDDASPEVEASWIAFPAPRHDGGAGSIFRVDADGLGHSVTPVPGVGVIVAEEESASVEIGDVDLDGIVRFLGGGAPASGDWAEGDTGSATYELELAAPVWRETAAPPDPEESTLEEALAAALGAMAGGRGRAPGEDPVDAFDPIQDSRYYFIEETRSSSELRMLLPEALVTGLGGPDMLLVLPGVTDFTEREGRLQIVRRWDQPMCVLLRASRVRFDRDGTIALEPVERLAWSEAVRWPSCESVSVTLHTTLDDKPAACAVRVDLLDRGRPIASRRIDAERFAPGDSRTFEFPLDPVLPLPRLRGMGVEVSYLVDPKFETDRWQLALEAVGHLDDGTSRTLVPKTGSLELGAGLRTSYEATFDITLRPLHGDPRSPMFSAIEITLVTSGFKRREDDVKVSLLLQGRTLAEERAEDESWERGHRRTFHFFVDPPIPYVGLDTMDMSVETQLLVDEGAGDDPWWMSIEVIGVLTGGDRVTLREADRPTRVGGDDPTLLRWDLR